MNGTKAGMVKIGRMVDLLELNTTCTGYRQLPCDSQVFNALTKLFDFHKAKGVLHQLENKVVVVLLKDVNDDEGKKEDYK
ncbi:hypothetical protein Tco_1531963 [Tanacetum coccineum]